MSTLNAVKTTIARRIVLVPVDARPVVRQQVVRLVATADFHLVTPPIEMLGYFRQSADCRALADWLMAEASTADGFVLSLDMLVYGGLVPSRFVNDDLLTLLSRLDVLHKLKALFPHKPIYAFLATMRISNNNVDAEEKLYWADYGELIWSWSFHSDRYAVQGDEASKHIAAETARLIPAEMRADYLATRQRNFDVALAALTMVENNDIDRLILPQDDTAAFGFNIAERRELEDQVAQRRLAEEARIYPGADEVAHTLCAHLVNVLGGAAPLKVFMLFSDPDCVKQLCARYEDRPILESIKSQLSAIDGLEVANIEAADVVLAIHTQGAEQGDWAMRMLLPNSPGIASSLWSSIAMAKELGKPVALLDLAYANGGDPMLMKQLPVHVPFSELAAYAGWNTASNSIGSLLAQCALARGVYQTPTNQELVCLRLVEDYLYQSIWRQRIRDVIDETAVSAEKLHAVVAQMFIPAANAWLAEHHFVYRVGSIQLPWRRTFEIDIHLVPKSTLQAS
jgi:hypothetical protein